MNLFNLKRKKSKNELIDEIHETFYTEVDRLLEEANIKKVGFNQKESIIAKANRLHELGFENTTGAIKGKKVRDDKKENDELKAAIEYFSFKYPQYKFITEESVKKICQKYGLVYGEVKYYKGDVPEYNLRQIENFKIDHNDSKYIYHEEFEGSIGRWLSVRGIEYIDHEEYLKKRRYINNWDESRSTYKHRFYCGLIPFEIAAPKSDFNTNQMEIKGFKISKIHIPDPVVLQPVFFLGKKHYLIVTAWGQEASDELVVNEKLN